MTQVILALIERVHAGNVENAKLSAQKEAAEKYAATRAVDMERASEKRVRAEREAAALQAEKDVFLMVQVSRVAWFALQNLSSALKAAFRRLNDGPPT